MLSFFAFHFQYPHIGCGVEEGREGLCQELGSVDSCVLSTALEGSALGCGGVVGGYALVKVWRGETGEVVEYLAATIVEDEDAEGCRGWMLDVFVPESVLIIEETEVAYEKHRWQGTSHPIAYGCRHASFDAIDTTVAVDRVGS